MKRARHVLKYNGMINSEPTSRQAVYVTDKKQQVNI
tara:strand:- start:32573 stop:32680 length:108 start_codon:yes stop_codon:yes gene_type:complete